MRVLFLSTNLGGNVPPIMAVARALHRRGVDVEVAGLLVEGGDDAPEEVWVSWSQQRDATGAPQPLGPTLARIFLSRRLAAETVELIRERQADVVVIDCMALALLKGALRSGVPVVAVFHTFAAYWRGAFLRGPVAAVVGALGFSPRVLWGAATARLFLTDAALDPARDDPEFDGYTWTGTTEVGAVGTGGGVPRVIVSFSTTPLAGMRRVYRNVIAALAELPVEAIVTTGGYDLGIVPPAANVQVRGYVPHSEVLPGAALVVGHGGHSTTMKALAHGIPLLVMPLNPTADQRLIGEIIGGAGLGRMISRRSDPATIRRAVGGLLADADVRTRARDVGVRLRAAPSGAEVAADRIVEISRGPITR